MKKKILITGADGFIGSHVVELFVKKGYQVRAFILYNSFNSYGWFDDIDINVKSKIDFFFGDIRNYDSVFASMQGCSAVLHLAALIGIPYSYSTPSSYLETNVTGTLNILQAAKNLKLKKIVLTSTSEVYGSAQYIPMDEKHPINPQSPYAASKVAADALGMSFHKSFNLPITILRPFNTFGPRQSSRAVIPTIINQFLGKNEHLNLGNIYPKRDFTYVEDSVNATLLAGISERSIGETFNVGTGVEISINNVIKHINNIYGKNIEPEYIDKRDIDNIRRRVVSIEKIRHKLRWSPQYSIEKGLKKTIDWYKSSI